jgi:calcium-dependent protein kinase
MKTVFGTCNYMAPEVINESYNEKCDLWSIGTIMYVLLVGAQPFPGTDEEVIEKIKKGKYDKIRSAYKSLSGEAKDLMSKLMKVNAKNRLGADEALQHSWFEGKETKTDNKEATLEALTNFKSYRAEAKLQQAACSFIVTQMATKEEIRELEKAFKELDLNKDGKLSRDELMQGY